MDRDFDEVVKRLHVASRVHIVGGSGAGKSRLAARLGTILALPVHHLDDVAIDPASHGRRSYDECRAAAKHIAAQPRWLSEGIYLDWTDDLLRAADAIIWLDNVSARDAKARIVRRFVRSAVERAMSERGERRFLRFGDYSRELRSLKEAIQKTGRYHRPNPPIGRERLGPTRSDTYAALAEHASKTVRIQSSRDAAALLKALA